MLGKLGGQQCRVMAAFFSAFSNTTRVKMLCSLQTGRKTVSELAEYAEVSMPNASQHLRVMREQGVVTTEKRRSSCTTRSPTPGLSRVPR